MNQSAEARVPVRFVYATGLKTSLLRDVVLRGSWDDSGLPSEQWSLVPMTLSTASADGCPCFEATVALHVDAVGRTFRWGVAATTAAASGAWVIPTEVQDANSTERTRQFVLLTAAEAEPQTERYYLTHCRYLGAQKVMPGVVGSPTGLRFAVWAPHARAVRVVFGEWTRGYIDDAGRGGDPGRAPIALRRGVDGVWTSDAATPALADFALLDHAPYMFEVTRADGKVVYRTDMHSRCQIGAGSIDPEGAAYIGSFRDLDGGVSCSVVVDPDTVTGPFKDAEWPGDRALFVSAEEFWADEFRPDRASPTRIEDLVIYELHVGSLGFGTDRAGNFADALRLLDEYLVPLGVNAIELLPVAEAGGQNEWGYGNTHHFAVEFHGGGRDQFKHFVRACHQRGIAVIVDVVYNHFSTHAGRAEWQYDSGSAAENSFYWYEDQESAYADHTGGYVDNGSSGYAPRFWEPMVRHQFISSAAALLEEFHVDGFRVDLTQALHRDNRLHATGAAVPGANQFGAKLLREWSRTLKLIRPSVFLIAEDHSGWDQVTADPDQGGLGFDAVWYADFHHNLVGSLEPNGWANLLVCAGRGGDEPLDLDAFAGSLGWSGQRKVVYHISHDEAGNVDPGGAPRTHRTMVQAVGGSAYVGSARDWAEARSRLVAGLALLSAGTPMFFMGEEVGAIQDYRWYDFASHREDLAGARAGAGARLFAYYADLIALRRASGALRSRNIQVLHVRGDNRVLAFRRWDGAGAETLIVASFANRPYLDGYRVEHADLADGGWREVFNSDAAAYGGSNAGNLGAVVLVRAHVLTVVVPAAGFVVLERGL